MITVLILLLAIVIIILLRYRQLDFKYSMPLILVLVIIYSLDKLVGYKHLSFVLLGSLSIILYSLYIISSYKKKLNRLVQENAILKYKLGKGDI